MIVSFLLSCSRAYSSTRTISSISAYNFWFYALIVSACLFKSIILSFRIISAITQSSFSYIYCKSISRLTVLIEACREDFRFSRSPIFRIVAAFCSWVWFIRSFVLFRLDLSKSRVYFVSCMSFCAACRSCECYIVRACASLDYRFTVYKSYLRYKMKQKAGQNLKWKFVAMNASLRLGTGEWWDL